MQKFTKKHEKQLKGVYCNLCGKQIQIEKGILKEGVVSVEQHWGYFSNKDGQIHSFDLCEECYDKMTDKFVLPVAVTEEKEYL